MDFVSRMGQGIMNNMPLILSTIGNVLSRLIQTIANNLPQVLQKGAEIIRNMANGIVKNIPTIVSGIGKVLAQLIVEIIKALPKILESGIKLVGELAAGLLKGIPKLLGAVPKLISSIWNGFKETNWLDLGSGIISGIASGVTGMAQNLWNTVKDVAGGILGRVKSFFGIASPSKVFRDQVGKMMAIGLGQGWEDNIPVDDMVGSVKDAFNEIADLSAPVIEPSFETGSGAEGDYNQTVSINIYPAANADAEEIAAMVQKEIVRAERQRRAALA
jgi:phage-related protein